jgi:hypothetical protein
MQGSQTFLRQLNHIAARSLSLAGWGQWYGCLPFLFGWVLCKVNLLRVILKVNLLRVILKVNLPRVMLNQRMLNQRMPNQLPT